MNVHGAPLDMKIICTYNMILDGYLSFEQKIMISMISGAIWIYYRTMKCYDLLKRRKMVSVIMVMAWIYMNYYEPLALPIGLLTMYAYSCFSENN